MSMQWYVVHAYSGFEKKVAQSLQEQSVVKGVEDWFEKILVPTEEVVEIRRGAKVNSESPAWAMDRLSILILKIYHMDEEAKRTDVSDDHKQNCQAKLDVLLEQQKDLSESIDQLLEDIASGEKKMRVYKQMKMYNDESLNPVLYKKDDSKKG